MQDLPNPGRMRRPSRDPDLADRARRARAGRPRRGRAVTTCHCHPRRTEDLSDARADTLLHDGWARIGRLDSGLHETTPDEMVVDPLLPLALLLEPLQGAREAVWPPVLDRGSQLATFSRVAFHSLSLLL